MHCIVGSLSFTPNLHASKKKTRKIKKALVVSLLLTIIVTSSLFWKANASSTIVKVSPSSTSANMGDSISVDIAIANVTNLKGWEFKLYYQRSILNCTGIIEGPFLQSVGSTYPIFQLNNTYNMTYGRVYAACALLGYNVSVSGSGVLATLNFNALRPGKTNLDLVETKLAGQGDPPPSIPHTAIGGTVTVTSSTVQVAVSPNYVSAPINSTFKINVTVTSVYDLRYWQCGIAFNPNVLICVNVTEGPFLMSGGPTVWQQGNIDNINGVVSPFASTLNTPTGVSGSGTLEYLEFKVGDTGSSPFTLQNTILLNSTLQEIKPIILLHGSFYLQPSQPAPPIAYFTYSPLTPYVNKPVTFNASQSDPRGGVIVSYNWSFGDNSKGSGKIASHTFNTVRDYNVTLIVTDSENLSGNFSRVITVSLLPNEYFLDVYTQRGGKGLSQPSDAFAPDELLLLTAYLAYNSTAATGKLVTFRLYYPNNTLMITRVAATESNGEALAAISIPESIAFGSYTANASSAVPGGIISDIVRFKIGWLLQVSSIETCDRYGNLQNQFGILEPLYLNLKIQNIRFGNVSASMSLSVMDEGYSPIINNNYFFTVPPNETTIILYAGLIPQNVHVGQAIAYFNIFQYNGGSPYCPGAEFPFEIVRSFPDDAVVALSMSSSQTYVGMSVIINVTILNKYYIPQNLNLTISANSTTLRKFSIPNLQPFIRTNFTILWNTYTFSTGNYKILAQISQVPGETNTTNNIMRGFVRLTTRTSPVHDIALTGATLSKTTISSLNVLRINVTIQNQGDYLDSFDLVFYVNNTIVGSQTNISLNPSASIAVAFAFNNAAWGNGKYVISAIAIVHAFENDTLDNQISVGPVVVTKPGDVNGDGRINVLDLITVAISLGATPTKPNWNCNADIVEDGRINILDLIAVAIRLGN